jgi:hypothetical protein
MMAKEKSEKKFVRISETMYEEHSASGECLSRWPKHSERLILDLFSACASEGEAYDRFPDFSSTELKLEPGRRRQYKKIIARGKIFAPYGVRFIGVPASTEPGEFKIVDVRIVPSSDELVDTKPHGSLMDVDDANKDDPRLSLSILAPSSIFESAWLALKNGAVSRLYLNIYVAVFRPELDHRFGPAWRPCYIEEGSSNPAVFAELQIDYLRTAVAPVTMGGSGAEDKADTIQGELDGETALLLQKNIALLEAGLGHLKVISIAVVAIAVTFAIFVFRTLR